MTGVTGVADHAAGARVELERRRQEERGRYYTPNGAFERVLLGLAHLAPASKDIYHVIIRAGNSAGKTCFAINLANFLSSRVPNPYFARVPYFARYRTVERPPRGRICTTANAAKNSYPDEIARWFSRGSYVASKRGRDFASYFKFIRTRAEFDLFTFDQDPLAGESITLDWAIVDEPMPRRHWTGLTSRFRYGGIIFFILTPLEGSGWYHDELEVEARLGKDVFVFEISALENTIEHGVRGVIPAAALHAQYRDYDAAELPARRDGKYLHLAGVIYKAYRQGYLDQDGRVIGHEPEFLPPYYTACWQKKLYTLRLVVDPHDRKPFILGWYATFPNGVTFVVAEWPDESMRPFHKITSCSWGYDDYAKMIKETELLLGKAADRRWIDPNFGPSPKVNSNERVMDALSRAGRAIGWPLRFLLPADSLKEGHLKVKDLLGDPVRGVAPRLFCLQGMKNHRFGFTHYGWKENRDDRKGLGETPELQHKDAMDLVRYLALGGANYLPPDTPAPDLYTPSVRGNGYRGA